MVDELTDEVNGMEGDDDGTEKSGTGAVPNELGPGLTASGSFAVP
jgi:hypothetical protein